MQLLDLMMECEPCKLHDLVHLLGNISLTLNLHPKLAVLLDFQDIVSGRDTCLQLRYQSFTKRLPWRQLENTSGKATFVLSTAEGISALQRDGVREWVATVCVGAPWLC